MQPTERQRLLLSKEDWRFHAIGPFGTGLGMLATSEFAQALGAKIVSFGVPSATALFLDAAIDANRKKNAIDLGAAFVSHTQPQGSYPDSHSELFDFFKFTTIEIIFSFCALEAFANENIPPDTQYEKSIKGKITKLRRSEIERQIQLDEKFKKILAPPFAEGAISKRREWQDFLVLKKLRDRIIHLKSVDRRHSGPEDQTLWGMLIDSRSRHFADETYRFLGLFPALVIGRRWYSELSKLLV